jgi:hypothetical protein
MHPRSWSDIHRLLIVVRQDLVNCNGPTETINQAIHIAFLEMEKAPGLTPEEIKESEIAASRV